MGQGNRWRFMATLAACGLLGACTSFGTHQLRAQAALTATQGSAVHGTVEVAERAEGIQIIYDIAGLEPNTQHTFALHVGGDCGGMYARNAGRQLRAADLPLAPSAGALDDTTRRSNQLTHIWADANGVAVGFFVLPQFTLDGVRSVIGRTLVVHRSVDDWGDESVKLAATPGGNPRAGTARGSAPKRSVGVLDGAADDAGHALACGVIVR